MKKHTRNGKHVDLSDYIYIRLTKDIKKRIKERARIEGSNMTIWARQTLMKGLEDEPI